jgi:hypothetical protein
MSEPPVPEAGEPEPTAAEPEASDETTPEDATQPTKPVDATQPTKPEDATQPTKPVRRIPRPALGALLLAVALVSISVAVYFVSSGSPKGQSAAAKAPVATTTPAPGTGKIPGTNTGASPGASTVKASPAASAAAPKPLELSDPARVESWNAGDGGTALARVTEDSGSILMAYGSGEYPETLQGCTALAGAVKKAAALPPIPDAAMQKLYVKSLDDFKSGITDCEAAITQHPEGVEDIVTDVNHAELNTAIPLFNAGAKNLYIATEVLRNH